MPVLKDVEKNSMFVSKKIPKFARSLERYTFTRFVNNYYCILESFNMNISHKLFEYKITLWINSTRTKIQKVILYSTCICFSLNRFCQIIGEFPIAQLVGIKAFGLGMVEVSSFVNKKYKKVSTFNYL